MDAISVPAEKQSLFLRLQPEDALLVKRLAKRLGGKNRPLSGSNVLEEALRAYLPVIDAARAITHRARPRGVRIVPRRYLIDGAVMDALAEISKKHGWNKGTIAHQALLALDRKTAGPDDKPRRRWYD